MEWLTGFFFQTFELKVDSATNCITRIFGKYLRTWREETQSRPCHRRPQMSSVVFRTLAGWDLPSCCTCRMRPRGSWTSHEGGSGNGLDYRNVISAPTIILKTIFTHLLCLSWTRWACRAQSAMLWWRRRSLLCWRRDSKDPLQCPRKPGRWKTIISVNGWWGFWPWNETFLFCTYRYSEQTKVIVKVRIHE